MKRTAIVLALLLIAAMPAAAQTAGPKVFISVDMEGIWGVVHGNQVSPATAEYGPARKWMVDDVNAVIAGLLEAGASEIVVNDSHGSQRNIIADQLNPRASLISGSPKPLSMMQGIDETFDAAIFVGYHGRAGSWPAILDHTISGGTIRSIRINGQEMPELGINAGIAAYYNVPVILVTGDTEKCAQTKALLGNAVVTAAVKEAAGRYAARNYPAEQARQRLREAAAEALRSLDRIKPVQYKKPYVFDVEFHNSGQSEMPTMLQNVKRVDARAVRFESNDFVEGFKLLRAVIALGGS
jgi:D-amino peptidase